MSGVWDNLSDMAISPLIAALDPAQLTVADRLALLDVLQRADELSALGAPAEFIEQLGSGELAQGRSCS